MNGLLKNAVVAVVLITWFCGGTASAETSAEISTTQLRHQTSKQLRMESVAKEGQAKDDAATALCDLYVVIRSDPRFTESQMLQGDAAKVRRRLLSIARRREIQLGRKGVERPENLSLEVETAVGDSLSAEERRSADSDRISQDASGGGAAAGGAASSAVGGGGWQLVELIQRIVAPDFWDQQGGKGTIHYFAMRRILVVRATSDVHAQVKDLLTALR